MREAYAINVWISEQRARQLDPSVAALVEEALAGLQVIRVPVGTRQRDQLLSRFPQAKCDTSTTGTIELLPRAVKDALLVLVLARGHVDVIDEYLQQIG